MGPAIGVATEHYAHHGTAAGVGGAHGRDKVAERVDRQHGSACVFALGKFHGLDYMGVSADNHFHSERVEIGSQ